MKHIRLTFDSISGMVPSPTHIKIEGVCHLISFQTLHKEFVSLHFIRIDDAQFSVLLTHPPVSVGVYNRQQWTHYRNRLYVITENIFGVILLADDRRAS